MVEKKKGAPAKGSENLKHEKDIDLSISKSILRYVRKLISKDKEGKFQQVMTKMSQQFEDKNILEKELEEIKIENQAGTTSRSDDFERYQRNFTGKRNMRPLSEDMNVVGQACYKMNREI